MSLADLVRSSRDGDQFHYYWAARQCLKLLRSDTKLVAVSIEGSSPKDPLTASGHGQDADSTGEYVIDIAEYYGDADPVAATEIIYRQLKHSTVRADQPWTASGLKRTLEGFARRFSALVDASPERSKRVSFEFVSNRPVDDSVIGALRAIGEGKSPAKANREVAKYFQGWHDQGLLREDLAGQFCEQFAVDDRAPALLQLDRLFRQDVNVLLPGAVSDGPLRLKEAITRRATSVEPNRMVTFETVLRALGASPEDLFPAPSRLEAPEALVPIPQGADIAESLAASRGPVVVHAAGGVGKSVLASQLARLLPPKSVYLVYDCFDRGDYRQSSSARHQHCKGYVQLANELASAGLCDPLIPVATASAEDYSRAFMARIRAAAESLAVQAPGALLVVAIDAADNAVIAAGERDTSFVVDLLVEKMPANARVVEFCRTERVHTLKPPPGTVKLELSGFELAQTCQHLELRFGQVPTGEAEEFHYRTGGNPRVQNRVMSGRQTVGDCLTRLSQVSGGGVATVDALLAEQVQTLIHESGPQEADGISKLCAALALLRPRIPVDVLVPLCGIPASLVRSFAVALGTSLLVEGDALQFLDEPTETWFRQYRRPEGDNELKAFVDRLLPLAAESKYVATSLPQLLWESGDFDGLVGLALTNDALPEGSDIERQQIAHQRLQFALKAALRQRAYVPAARLALWAGAHDTGRSRLLRLLRENSDLAGTFLDNETIEDLVAARDLKGDWPNSNLVHEGALLSFARSPQGYARSRLRSAIEAVEDWAGLPSAARQGRDVSPDDIAEIAFGLLNVDGAAACVEFLQRQASPHDALQAAAAIVSRLAQHGRDEEIKDLLSQEHASEHVLVGVASSAAQAGLMLDSRALERCAEMLRARTEPIEMPSPSPRRRDPTEGVRAVCWIVALGSRYGLLSRTEAERILLLYLPTTLPISAGSWSSEDRNYSHVIGLALLSRLRGGTFDINRFEPEEVKAARQRVDAPSGDAADFLANVEPFAAWADLLAEVMLGEATDADAKFKILARKARRIPERRGYGPTMFMNAVARTGSFLLALIESSSESREEFTRWTQSSHQLISSEALTEIVQHASGPIELHDLAEKISSVIYDKSAGERSYTQIANLVRLSRAIYRMSSGDSRAYFQEAMQSAELVGEDITTRLSTLVKIGEAASRDSAPNRERANRLAQVTESVAQVTQGRAHYLDRSGTRDYGAAIHAIARLDPRAGTAVASRWRDRRIALLEPMIRALALRGDSPLASEPLACVAMAMFQQQPEVLPAAERAIRLRPAAAQLIVDTLAGLPPFMIDAQSCLDALCGAAGQSDATFDGSRLRRYEAPRHPGYAEPDGSDKDHEDEPGHAAASEKDARVRLAGLNLTRPDGIAAARALCRETPLVWEDVMEAAPRAKLDEVIRALTDDTRLSGSDYGEVISALASRAPLRPSAKSAVRDMARTLARRFCVGMTTRSDDLFNMAALKAAAGDPDLDPMVTALEELGRQPETLPGEACFALAGRLTGTLEPAQAAQVFDFASSLYDQYQDMALAAAADAITDDPALPASVSDCIAGFIWAALGDAAIATRWRAAHAVCALVSLRESAVLEALAGYASGEHPIGPFVDQHLHFYDKHALTWLLLALERSASAADLSGLSPFIPLLIATAEAGQDHVLVRESVRNVLLALHCAGLVSLEPAALAELERANQPIELRPGELAWPATRTAGSEKFFYGFDRELCRPLAEAFGLAETDVVQLASDVADREWGLPHSMDGDEDERRNRHLIADSSGVWAYQNYWPEEDDLGVYLGFHALMTVAGRLIQQRPVSHDKLASHTRFDKWLDAFRPSRRDGRWLADRRDPAPRPALALPPPASTGPDDWEESLSADSFGTCVSGDGEWLTVWEDSAELGDRRRQDIRIESVLADTAHSHALAAALQSAGSYRVGYLLTTVPDHHWSPSDPSIDKYGYRLSGWMTFWWPPRGLDVHDPLAARTAFPPPQPSAEFIELLGLSADEDKREWRRGGALVMRSTVWDDVNGKDWNARGPGGRRFEVKRDFLSELLRLTDSHLIIRVMMGRSNDARRHRLPIEYNLDDHERFPKENSYRVFIFGSDGADVGLRFGR